MSDINPYSPPQSDSHHHGGSFLPAAFWSIVSIACFIAAAYLESFETQTSNRLPHTLLFMFSTGCFFYVLFVVTQPLVNDDPSVDLGTSSGKDQQPTDEA